MVGNFQHLVVYPENPNPRIKSSKVNDYLNGLFGEKRQVVISLLKKLNQTPIQAISQLNDSNDVSVEVSIFDDAGVELGVRKFHIVKLLRITSAQQHRIYEFRAQSHGDSTIVDISLRILFFLDNDIATNKIFAYKIFVNSFEKQNHPNPNATTDRFALMAHDVATSHFSNPPEYLQTYGQEIKMEK